MASTGVRELPASERASNRGVAADASGSEPGCSGESNTVEACGDIAAAEAGIVDAGTLSPKGEGAAGVNGAGPAGVKGAVPPGVAGMTPGVAGMGPLGVNGCTNVAGVAGTGPFGVNGFTAAPSGVEGPVMGPFGV